MDDFLDKLKKDFPNIKFKIDYLEINDGWCNLVYNLCKDISALDDTGKTIIKVVQVKEKFGGLRFYFHHSDDNYDLTDECHELIERINQLVYTAEHESYNLCVFCGKETQDKLGMSACCKNHNNGRKD